jgi:hypothetical protein
VRRVLFGCKISGILMIHQENCLQKRVGILRDWKKDQAMLP